MTARTPIPYNIRRAHLHINYSFHVFAKIVSFCVIAFLPEYRCHLRFAGVSFIACFCYAFNFILSEKSHIRKAIEAKTTNKN